jgi:SulP family sulfate permease
MAIGASNLLAGLSEGFVQAGGASQTAAADSAGGKSQVTSIVAAGCVLLTGAFLAPVFKDLPEATLGAIVIVAVSGFFRVDELRRFARIRSSALILSLLALFSVLVLGVLQGLIVAAAVSLMLVIQHLSRPSVGTLARDPRSGNWGRAARHPDWLPSEGLVVARVDGQLFYANSQRVKDRLLKLTRQSDPLPRAVVLDLSESVGLDLQSVDTLAELGDELSSQSVELRLAMVRAPVIATLKRAGVSDKFRIEPTVDAAIADERPPIRRRRTS